MVVIYGHQASRLYKGTAAPEYEAASSCVHGQQEGRPGAGAAGRRTAGLRLPRNGVVGQLVHPGRKHADLEHAASGVQIHIRGSSQHMRALQALGLSFPHPCHGKHAVQQMAAMPCTLAPAPMGAFKQAATRHKHSAATVPNG